MEAVPITRDEERPATSIRTSPQPSRIRKRPLSFKRLFIYMFLGSYCLSSVAAFIWVFVTSLKSNPEFVSTSPWSLPAKWNWINYVNAWRHAHIGEYFLNSVIVSVTATVVGVLVAAMGAYVLSRVATRYNEAILQTFLAGMMVPGILVVIPLYRMYLDLGLIDSLVGLILVYVTMKIPFNLFVLTGFFKTLPRELEDAAAVDGCSPFYTFWRIMLPLAGPGLAAVTVLGFLFTWNEFFFALVLTTKSDYFTLPVGLFNLNMQALYGSAWVQLFAGIMMTVVPVLLVYAFLQEHVNKGLSSGALKG